MRKVMIIWLLGFPCWLMAQVDISGFFDILYQREVSTRENLGFNYGQFEVDISSSLSNYTQIEGALAYNPDEQKVELGAGFIDFHLFGSDEEHPIRGKFLTHSGVMIGQFDVPFGIDYLSIPSPDRKLISTPLVNEMTINSWNDFGLNIYGANMVFNFTLFSVNGFNGGVALGGRTGLTALPNVEIGLSYMADLENLVVVHNSILGIDFQSHIGNNEFKFEYQLADGIYCGEQDEATSRRKHSGYYIHNITDFENWIAFPVFTVVRYGAWSAEFDKDNNGTNDYQSRITVGLGYRVGENTEIRTEYFSNQVEEENRQNQFTFQTVVSF